MRNKQVYKSLGVLLLLLLLGAPLANAQLGKIFGKVVDGEESMPYTRVELRDGASILSRTMSDSTGKYEIAKVEPGQYSLLVISGDLEQEFGVRVGVGETVIKDLRLNAIGTVRIVDYEKQLFTIDPSDPIVVTRRELRESNIRDPEDLISAFGGVYQADQGDPLNIKGGRPGAIVTFQDGVKLVGTSDLPAAAINQVTLLDGGIPAEYGDVTSGVLIITTYNPGMRGHAGKPMSREERKELRKRQRQPDNGSQINHDAELMALAR